MKAIITLAGMVIVFLLGMSILFGSWYTVDQTERAVILRNGTFVGISEPGLHFKTPMVDSAIKFSTLTQVSRWEKVDTYSSDQQPAKINISVNYHIGADQVENYYSEYGSDETAIVNRLLEPRILQQLKDIFGGYTAQRAIQDRATLNKQVQDAFTSAVSNKPIVVESVQIEDITFSPTYEQAVEQRMMAEVSVAKQRQNLENEKILAQIALTQAQGRANSVKAEADAKAYAAKVQGDAEASAIEARGKALKDNPNLPQLVQAERWNGVLPHTMLPGNAVPMLNLENK